MISKKKHSRASFFKKLKSIPVDWNYQAAIVSHHQDYESISLSTPKLNPSIWIPNFIKAIKKHIAEKAPSFFIPGLIPY